MYSRNVCARARVVESILRTEESFTTLTGKIFLFNFR